MKDMHYNKQLLSGTTRNLPDGQRNDLKAIRCSLTRCGAGVLFAIAVFFAVVASSPLCAQQQRPRDREPSWMMDKVEGPNLHYRTFYSKTAGTQVSYLIYLPPGYEKDDQRRFPVVYWLHGIGGSQQGVPGFAASMNEAIAAGKMPPVIFVYCNGMIRSGWNDSQWPVETVTIKELIPYIDANYRTIATREGRGVEGFSMGGGGAAVWGFKYPELFGTVSIIAGAMRDPSAPPSERPGSANAEGAKDGSPATGRGPRVNPWELVEKNYDAIKGRQFIRIVVGELDGLVKSNTSLHEFLEKKGIEHEFHIAAGQRHSPGPVYQELGDANFAFYQKAFGHVK